MIGFCLEHSPLDGIAVILAVEEILSKTRLSPTLNEKVSRPPIEQISSSHITPLQWNVQSNLNKYIREASQSMDK